MKFARFTACVAASAALTFACTAETITHSITDDPTDPGTSSSGGSSGKTSSSSSGGKTSSSGGSSSGGSSSGGSSSGGSSSGGSSSGGSSSGGSTSSGGSSSGGSSSGGSSSGGSTSSSGGTSGLCPENVPLTAADLDAEIGWKSATKTPGACSAADLTTLQNNFQSTTINTYLDLGNGLSASCKACAISYDTDADWGPIVATFANGGDTGFVNFGACFGNVEGATCGKALQYEQFCYNIACGSCTSTTQRNACVSSAGSTGMCKDFGTTTGTACPNINTTNTTCGSVIDAVKYLCQ